jgi:TPR repeat protein
LDVCILDDDIDLTPPPITQALQLHRAKDYEQAYAVFKRHADAPHMGTHADGLYWTGFYTFRGLGGQTQDLVAAVDLFGRAADCGNVDAQLRYGASLMKGEGVAKDAARGFQYLLKAADTGNMAAQFNVGHIFWTGKVPEVEKRPEEGKRYLQMAARQGHPNAKTLCDSMGLVY